MACGAIVHGEIFDTGVVLVEAATVRLKLTPSSLDEGPPFRDTGTTRLALRPSGTDVRTTPLVDSGTGKLTFRPSVTEQYPLKDATTARLRLAPSGADVQFLSKFVGNRANVVGTGQTTTFHPSATCLQGNTLLLLITTCRKADIVSVTDSKGNTYTIDVPSAGGTTIGQGVVRGLLTHGLTTADTITVVVTKPSGAVGQFQVSIIADEISGLLPIAVFDVSAVASGTGLRVTAGPTATTAQTNEMVYGGAGADAHELSFSQNSGYFVGAQQFATQVSAASIYRTATSQGNFTNGGTFTGSTGSGTKWAGVIATYKIAGITYVEVTTSRLSLRPSSTDIRARPDAATARLKATPYEASLASGESGTLHLALRPTTFFSAEQAIEAGTAQLRFTVSDTEGQVFAESGTEHLKFTISGTEQHTLVESGTERLALTPSSTQVAGLVDTATSRLSLIPSSTEIRTHFEAATARATLTPTAVDIAAYADSAVLHYHLTTDGTDEKFIPIGFPYADVGDPWRFIFTPSSSDTRGSIDADTGQLRFLLAPLIQEEHGRFDANTVRFGLAATGSDLDIAIDSATARTALTPSTVEHIETLDSGVPRVRFVPSTTDVFAGTDSDRTYLAATPHGTEETTFIDSGNELFTFTVNGTEKTPTLDIETALLALVPSGVDIHRQEVRLVFTADGVEVISLADTGIVRLAFRDTVFAEAGIVFIPRATMKLKWNGSLSGGYVVSGDARYAGSLAGGYVTSGGPRWGGRLNG